MIKSNFFKGKKLIWKEKYTSTTQKKQLEYDLRLGGKVLFYLLCNKKVFKQNFSKGLLKLLTLNTIQAL